MELRHLRYFEALGRTLNFTRAAEQLHIAQPPLSRQIRQLEEELGAELIDREARPLALTKAGTFFLEQCTQLLARVKEVQEATRRISQGQRRWLGIGFVPSALYGFLPELIRSYGEQSKGVEIVLSEMTSVQQATALKSGRIDIGFGRLPLEDPEIICETIAEEALVAALPLKHPLLKSPRLTLAALAKEPFILYPVRPRPSYADQVLQQFRIHGLTLSSIIDANEMQTAIGLVAAGVGVTLVPSSVQRLRRDDIVYRPLSDSSIMSPIIMNRRAGNDSPDLIRFCELVKIHAKGTPPTPRPRRRRSA
ncbi:DNA-binding transcriptional LysR family regulator [Paucimonas lemoignei]|uniref:DNA-binding transcriptional LysR family regulator n=1 Tax=Paucimonas lemoignei TaxID=29443 RepID=A0A4R3HX32_PAULE|nr:LysR family transcriptional regulator [Paucimonas lemoignei]TCS37364.1 DNA-binding transcriptional LysR family regulator [Paucimonas lemoignei]